MKDEKVYDDFLVLKYLGQLKDFDTNVLFKRDGKVSERDRCTASIDDGEGLFLRCRYKGVKKFSRSGVVVWNRCGDCLNETVEVIKEFTGRKDSVISYYSYLSLAGDTGRFLPE